jgi:hypothetical protein
MGFFYQMESRCSEREFGSGQQRIDVGFFHDSNLRIIPAIAYSNMDDARPGDLISEVVAPIDATTGEAPSGGRVDFEIEIPGGQLLAWNILASEAQLLHQDPPVRRKNPVDCPQLLIPRPPPVIVIVRPTVVAAELLVTPPVEGRSASYAVSLHRSLFFHKDKTCGAREKTPRTD